MKARSLQALDWIALFGNREPSFWVDCVTSTIRSDCYRLERQLAGGIRIR